MLELRVVFNDFDTCVDIVWGSLACVGFTPVLLRQLTLKSLFYPECLARVVSLLAFAAIFIGHKNGDIKAKQEKARSSYGH